MVRIGVCEHRGQFVKRVTSALVDELIDFAPSERAKKSGFAAHQREGTVALFNMLADNRCAYLADEVGMGKTYVALGVMGVLRTLNPRARIVVIAPRENIQQKWRKEQSNFVRCNWKFADNRVRSLQDTPAWAPATCRSLLDFAHELCLAPDRDFFLRMPSFSVALSDVDRRRKLRRGVRKLLPWLDTRELAAKDVEGFRDGFGRAINAAVPDIDLLVVDEAHNLKHGFSRSTSTRNRLLGLVFGKPSAVSDKATWYKHRVKRVLLLSATPFEEDYAAVQRQLDIFGFGDAQLTGPKGESSLCVSGLADRELSDNDKQAIASRLIVRRVSGLRIGGELHTRNMYRREWRRGGLEEHGKELAITDPRQRLVVGLVQKKVAEVLGNERFNNRFQIGMLSSFESFLESVARLRERADAQDEDDPSRFDGDQDANQEERAGIDTEAIAELSQSYWNRFGARLPHPKLDATCASLGRAFEHGDKSLVFVRRVATVSEMASRLETMFDGLIKQRMLDALPLLKTEINQIFARYERERARRPDEEPSRAPAPQNEREMEQEDGGRYVGEDDDGGAESFFAWFFRGAGPKGVLSGGAFQKNRLASTSSVYSTLFEYDYVSSLLGCPHDVFASLAKQLGQESAELARNLRTRAYRYFSASTKQKEGYPRLLVFDAYQVAGLELLVDSNGSLGDEAEMILQERYERPDYATVAVPRGFPGHAASLGVRTFFVQLEQRHRLCDELWPRADLESARDRFRQREQRRELASAMLRLGAPFVDLYLLAIKALGSFGMRVEAQVADPMTELASALVAELESQRDTKEFSAYAELHAAAGAFETLLAVNFEAVPAARLSELASIYGTTLQRQVPVGRMSGGVNKRLVRQFRMPGFPLVLISTDVLQEGEDLHTFCRNVVHYGITWTPSATEQRTGRVDRIGSLTQRRHDGRDDSPTPGELLQVFYPYLRDTVEVLQVQEVFRRLNRFVRLIHRNVPSAGADDSRIDAAQRLLEGLVDIEPVKERLESAFPVEKGWELGKVGPEAAVPAQIERLEAHLSKMWDQLLSEYDVVPAKSFARRREGRAWVIDGELAAPGCRDGATEVPFELELRSQAAGGAALLRCKTGQVKRIDPRNDDDVDALYELQRSLGGARICLRLDQRRRHGIISVEEELFFDPSHTQAAEVAAMVRRAVAAAESVRQMSAAAGRTRLQRRQSTEVLHSEVDKLIGERSLPWQRSGSTVHVQLWNGRKQRVTLGTFEDLYTFTSVAARSAFVTESTDRWNDFAVRVWRKNALSELVGFAFDRKHNLIGIIEQPQSSLEPEELFVYIDAVARECDRLEYALTGKDVE